jgi:glucan 1,3-beta-glucosidase
MGRRYTTFSDNGTTVQADVTPAPSKPAILLDSTGAIYSQSKPQYETYEASSFINVKSKGVANDGTGDQSGAINNILASAGDSIVFFPAGIYQVMGTVFVPVGSRIVGEGWSQIMATGSYWQDSLNPLPVVQYVPPSLAHPLSVAICFSDAVY